MTLLRRARDLLLPLQHTPLHPQWLLHGSAATAEWPEARAWGRAMAGEAMSRPIPGIVLFPLVPAVIPAISITSWLLSRLLPSWPVLTAAYRLTAVRP